MRRSTDASEILVGHVIHFVEEFGACNVIVRHESLDSSDDEFVAQSGLEFLEMVLQIGRRYNEYKRVVSLNDAVYVAREEYLVGVEVYTREIIRVVADALELLYAVVTAYIPTYVMGMTYHNLGYCSSPATAANNSNFSAVEHFVLCLMNN